MTEVTSDLQAKKILWLASYPKTGSTWLRELVSNMIWSGHESRATIIPSFQKSFPDTPHTFRICGGECAMVKTHLYPSNPRMDMVPMETLGAITIVRHPFDILLSALNYALVKDHAKGFIDQIPRPVEEIIKRGELEHYIKQFADQDGFPWFSGPSAELSLYAERWRTGMRGKPHLELIYEDMFADPGNAVEVIATFLFGSSDGIDVEAVLSASDANTAQNGRFFWKRRSYNFTQMVPEELIRTFEDLCGYQLDATGYKRVAT